MFYIKFSSKLKDKREDLINKLKNAYISIRLIPFDNLPDRLTGPKALDPNECRQPTL